MAVFLRIFLLFIVCAAIPHESCALFYREMEQKIADLLPQNIRSISDYANKKIVVYPLHAYSLDGEPCCKECTSANHAANVMPMFIENALIGQMLVLERKQLNNVLNELKLQFSALFDYDTAKKVGKLMNADYVVLGDAIYDGCQALPYGPYGIPVTIRIRFVELETGVVRTGVIIK